MTALGVSIAVLAIWWFSRPPKHVSFSEFKKRANKIGIQ